MTISKIVYATLRPPSLNLLLCALDFFFFKLTIIALQQDTSIKVTNVVIRHEFTFKNHPRK